MLTIFLIAAGLVFLLSIDFGWSNVLTSNRNELVFENRNHDYGAYALRREHHLNLFYAMIIGSGLVIGLISLLSLQSNPRVPESIAATLINVDLTPENLAEEDKTEQQAAPKRNTQASAVNSGGEVEVTPEPQPVDPAPSPTPSPGPVDPSGPQEPGIPGPAGTGGNGNDPSTKSTPPVTPTVIPDYAPVMPEFPGGDAALIAYIKSKVEYDEMSINQGVEGTIYISFVVTVTGEIDQIKVIRSMPNGQRLVDQTVSVVRSLPRWKPGMQNDRPVPVRRTIPIRFDLH
jgi:periplasmic protein TonB